MPLWEHAFMGACVYGSMHLWEHAFMGACVYRSMCLWEHAFRLSRRPRRRRGRLGADLGPASARALALALARSLVLT